MTTRVEATEAIYQEFVDGWGSEAFTFDDEKFDPPDAAFWARLTVRHSDSRQDTLGKTGNRRFTRLGSVFVQVFTLANEGGRAASDVLAETVRGIFEGVSLAGTTVRFTSVSISEIGPDGKWYGQVVEAAFEYDEIK